MDNYNENYNELEALKIETENLPRVTPGAAEEYATMQDVLVELVNQALGAHSRLHDLIGPNPRETMYDNHTNHARFLASVFQLNNYDLLIETIPWVYRTYRARGFSTDYFPLVLQTFMHAIDKTLSRGAAENIKAIYQWILDRHPRFLTIASQKPSLPPWPKDTCQQAGESFLAALLRGDHGECLHISHSRVQTATDLEDFYLYVVEPAMYRIGLLWERNEVSVVQEHMATAIVSRVMAGIYSRIAMPEVTLDRAVVTCAPNEYHELGARMVADFLELDGWDVNFLGANTPRTDLLDWVQKAKPYLLAVSVGVPTNLDRAKEIISSVHEEFGNNRPRIIVGGQALRANPGLLEALGADGWAFDSRAAVTRAREMWEQGGKIL